MNASAFHLRMVNEHIDELVFLLHLRESLTPFSQEDVREWLGLDRRIFAHIQGLTLREARAWTKLRELLERRPTKDFLRLLGILAVNSAQTTRLQEYFDLVAAHQNLSVFAEDAVRWATPEARVRAHAWFEDRKMMLPSAVAFQIELSNSFLVQGSEWQELLNQALATGVHCPQLERAISRVIAIAAVPALFELFAHGRHHVQLAAACALMGLAEDVPQVNPFAGPSVLPSEGTGANRFLVRTVLRADQSSRQQLLADSWRSGFREATVIAIGALGEASLLPVLVSLMREPDIGRPAARIFKFLTGFSPVKGQAELAVDDAEVGSRVLYPHLQEADAAAAAIWLSGPGQTLPQDTALVGGQPRTFAGLATLLQQGDCIERLICSEVLLPHFTALRNLDVYAPMYQQIKHPAMSKPLTT
jgi:hypothetical protein